MPGKTLKLTIAVLLLTSLTNAQKPVTINTVPSKFVLELTEKYSPYTYHLLTKMTEPQEYTAWLGNSRKADEVLDHMGTYVHESCHGYNSDIDDREFGADVGYFIDPQNEYWVTTGKVFSSYELNKIVPDSLKKKMFRYEDYIGDKQVFLGAQKNGIYGLLEEMCAYYHGALASFQVKPWYLETYGFKTAEPWISGYIVNAGKEMTGFYEFRIFMAWYLTYAKKKYPEQYKAILANETFRKAFTLIYDRSLALCKSYEAAVYEVEKTLNENGHNVKVEKDYFYIYKTGEASHGYGHYLNQIKWLNTIFTPELETTLNELRSN